MNNTDNSLKIPIALSISCTNSNEILIEIRDNNSRVIFCECTVAPGDFALALTGRGYISATAEIRGLEYVGKTYVREKRVITAPNLGYEKEKYQEWLRDHGQEEGWIVDDYLGSRDSVSFEKEGVVLRYSVYKYIEKGDS